METGSDTPPAAKTGVRYDDLQEGQTCEVRRRLTGEAIDAFARASGDHNPLHTDREFAIAAGFPDRIAHGMLLASWISAALAEDLPGRGTLYLRQSLEFRQAALPGDELLVRLSVSEKKRRGRVILSCLIINEATGKELLRGSAEVIAPS
ncbi:MAG: MaoC family dehydratase [Pseudomonadota bacterium]